MHNLLAAPRRMATRLLNPNRDECDPQGLLINGLISLAFSLIVWRLTGSFLGWLALFLPGATLVMAGWVHIWRSE